MTFDLRRGAAPLLVSIPHVGTAIPDAIAARMTQTAAQRGDTDWHLDRLYDFAIEMGATVLAAHYSRYVIDLNRPPDGVNLYPGQATTPLCPIDTFDRNPLYREGEQPGADEIAARIATYWTPYHDALAAELGRLCATHGRALLFEAHSIRGRLPRLFEGRLPDLNLGTNRGNACDPVLRDRLQEVAARSGRTWALDGRFVGGYITRRYGAPAAGVHAVQLELVQETYMDEAPPFGYRADRAATIRPALRELLTTMLAWAQA